MLEQLLVVGLSLITMKGDELLPRQPGPERVLQQLDERFARRGDLQSKQSEAL